MTTTWTPSPNAQPFDPWMNGGSGEQAPSLQQSPMLFTAPPMSSWGAGRGHGQLPCFGNAALHPGHQPHPGLFQQAPMSSASQVCGHPQVPLHGLPGLYQQVPSQAQGHPGLSQQIPNGLAGSPHGSPQHQQQGVAATPNGSPMSCNNPWMGYQPTTNPTSATAMGPVSTAREFSQRL